MPNTYYWSSASSTDGTASGNWTNASAGTTGTTPTTGDSVVLRGVPGVTLANIAASDLSAVTLASLIIEKSWPAQIGTTAGYFKISATSVRIDGSGSSRIKINFGSVQTAVTILGSGSTADTGYEAIRLLGTHASNVLYVINGTVGIGTNLPGEAATLLEVDAAGSTSVVNVGSGVTWTTAQVSDGGTMTLGTGSSSGTLNVAKGSSATVNGTVKVATVNVTGAAQLNQRPAAGDCVTTLTTFNGGVSDFSDNPAAGTVNSRVVYPGAKVKVFSANPSHITFTGTTLGSGVGTVAWS